MMKKSKKIIATILVILTSIMCINHIEAFKGRIPSMSFGTPSGSSKQPDAEVKVVHSKVLCDYDANYKYLQEIDINAYDMQGNTIVPFSHISLSKFRAGTWIGINLRESKDSGWDIEIPAYYEIEKKYICGWDVSAYGQKVIEECKEAYQEELKAWEAAASAYATCASSAAAAQTECASKAETPEAKEACASAGESCTSPGNKPEEDCDIECLPSKFTLPYYYEEDTGKLPTTMCYGEYITAVRNNEPVEIVDHSEDLCAPTSIGYDEDGDKGDLVGPKTFTDQKKTECDVEAVKKAVNGGLSLLYPTLEFQLITPNDYNKENVNMLTFSKTKTFADLEHPITVDTEPDPKKIVVSTDELHQRTYMPADFKKYVNSIKKSNYKAYMQREYYATYEYIVENTCINVKTGDVSYDNSICKGSNKNIKKIEDGVTKDQFLNAKIDPDEDVNYWHYFIPLDTHTSYSEDNDVGFFMRVSTKNSNPIITDNCMIVLQNYPVDTTDDKMPNYMNFISPIPKDGSNLEFVGDYYGEESSGTSRDMKLFSEQGYQCKFSIKVKFNVEQKFYGEYIDENDKNKIKGYGFYYRPINPNEPFPNSIASDSIWLGLYEDNTITVKDKEGKTISTMDLTNSFDKVTYTTKNISFNELKKTINNGNAYTNWKNMNLDGTSPISKKLRTGNDNLYQIYKLGCGPYNTEWSGCK